MQAKWWKAKQAMRRDNYRGQTQVQERAPYLCKLAIHLSFCYNSTDIGFDSYCFRCFY